MGRVPGTVARAGFAAVGRANSRAAGLGHLLLVERAGDVLDGLLA